MSVPVRSDFPIKPSEHYGSMGGLHCICPYGQGVLESFEGNMAKIKLHYGGTISILQEKVRLHQKYENVGKVSKDVNGFGTTGSFSAMDANGMGSGIDRKSINLENTGSGFGRSSSGFGFGKKRARDSDDSALEYTTRRAPGMCARGS